MHHGLRGAARAQDQGVPPAAVDLARDREPVGGRPDNAIVRDEERVHRPRGGRHLVELVAVDRDPLLVRDRDVRAGEAQGRKAANGGLEPLRRCREGDVRPVERERGERGVVQARR